MLRMIALCLSALLAVSAHAETAVVQWNYLLPLFSLPFNGSSRVVIRPERQIANWPDPAIIRGTLFFAQAPITGFPAGCGAGISYCGDITVAVDPGCSYVKANNWPANEYPWQPSIQTFKTIGVYEFFPGSARGPQYRLPAPVTYSASRGDCIVFAPEPIGSFPLDPVFGLYFESATDQVVSAAQQPLPSLWTNEPTTDSAGNPGTAIRVVAPITGCPVAGCTKIQVCALPLQSGINANAVSIGIQSSGSTMTATPVPVTFNANLNFNVGWTGTAQDFCSDYIPFVISNGQNLLVDLDSFASANLPYVNGSYSGYISNAPSAGTAAMQGTVASVPNRTWVISQVHGQ